MHTVTVQMYLSPYSTQFAVHHMFLTGVKVVYHKLFDINMKHIN